jgi:hypothetical protein
MISSQIASAQIQFRGVYSGAVFGICLIRERARISFGNSPNFVDMLSSGDLPHAANLNSLKKFKPS